MSKKSVLEISGKKTEAEKKLKGSYGLVIPTGTISITINGDNLILDIAQPTNRISSNRPGKLG
jgi:hypothetical protein